MTPEERNLLRGLFERLERLEQNPRDREAEQVIREGLKRAPHAVYALAQTVLVQDEALRVANDRIEALEREKAQGARGGEAGNRWNTGAVLGGERPSGRPMGLPPSFGRGAEAREPAMAAQPAGGREPSQAGSFLGTAAAAAIGVIGGSLLMNGIRSALGGQDAASGAGGATEAKSPFADLFERLTGDGKEGGSGDLARQSGVDDVGNGSRQSGWQEAAHDEDNDDYDDDEDDYADADDDGFGFFDGDTA